MSISPEEVYAVLREFNPWWSGAEVSSLPQWSRTAFKELYDFTLDEETDRAVLLTGARRVGKTTLLLQLATKLIESGVSPLDIVYMTLDHPLLKLYGLEQLITAWKEVQPGRGNREFLLIDEIQNQKDWQVWVKHQVDFRRNRRIVLTGSAVPLRREKVESGAGRIHAIRLPTLSFYEYLRIRGEDFSDKLPMWTMHDLWNLDRAERLNSMRYSAELSGHFHEYLVRGGFPETARITEISKAQKLLREDILDRVLKRDMSDLYNVRHLPELERLFLYLAYHDGGILNVATLTKELSVSRPTVEGYLDILEAAHLLYRLKPYGYGKRVLKGSQKAYLADPAIAGSLYLKGKRILEEEEKLGAAVEAVFFKHVFTRYYRNIVAFSYWRDKKGNEVDVIGELPDSTVAFEVKYKQKISPGRDGAGLKMFIQKYGAERGYLITRKADDFGPMNLDDTVVLKVPAPLACYCLSCTEGLKA